MAFHGDWSKLSGLHLFFELIQIPLLGGGYYAANFATVGVTCGAAFFFAQILTELRIPSRGLAVLHFICLPIIFINAGVTMDYLWSLAFILGAFVSILRGKFTLA
jgi:hypothetical protein